MTYSDLLAEVKKLKFLETRSDTQELLEFVIATAYHHHLQTILESFFGPALKPAGESPHPQAQKYTAAYGGIQKNQTLYYTHRDGCSFAAMIWPWGDKLSATVKIFQL